MTHRVRPMERPGAYGPEKTEKWNLLQLDGLGTLRWTKSIQNHGRLLHGFHENGTKFEKSCILAHNSRPGAFCSNFCSGKSSSTKTVRATWIFSFLEPVVKFILNLSKRNIKFFGSKWLVLWPRLRRGHIKTRRFRILVFSTKISLISAKLGRMGGYWWKIA